MAIKTTFAKYIIGLGISFKNKRAWVVKHSDYRIKKGKSFTDYAMMDGSVVRVRFKTPINIIDMTMNYI